MEPGIHLLSVAYSSCIDRVAQDLVEMPTGERQPAGRRAGLQNPQPCAETEVLQGLAYCADGARSLIAIIDLPDDGGFVVADRQGSAFRLIAKGHAATHPHALAFGRSDLVANALGGDLAFELREGQKHIQGQAPYWWQC